MFKSQSGIEKPGVAVIYLTGNYAHGKASAAFCLQYFINIVIKKVSHVANISINGDILNYFVIFAYLLNEISMIKKVLGVSAVLAAALFVACDNKENSYNFAQILYPVGAGSVLYADQTLDSVRFATTYDWAITVPAEWMHVSSDSLQGTVPSGFFMVKKINFQLDANNTDTTRVGYVYFHADGKTLITTYTQYHYLNISRPVRRNYEFVLQDTARQDRDSLVFQTYSDGWTLAFKGSAPTWVRLAEGAATTGRAGKYVVYYDLDHNTTSSERSAELELQSCGVVTPVKIRQLGLEEE